MLSLTTINLDGERTTWNYKSLEELSKEYWSDHILKKVPANDDPVTECEFDGTPLYPNTFLDLINIFGINNESHYWKKKNDK